jgi:hypothetical protein
MSILKNIELMYEPKKENRFIINLPENLGLSKWVAYATQRPKYKLSGASYVWEPIEIKFRDPIAPSTTGILWEKFIIGKNDNFDYTLEMLDPIGSIVEKWEINGCRVLSIDFGELNYSSESIVTCTIIVQPSNVQLLF